MKNTMGQPGGRRQGATASEKPVWAIKPPPPAMVNHY